jgi:DNA mismatch endonuclease (patch repair protein)
VFVDGDYWHGWRFPAWKNKLPPYWQEKIENNRRRDQRNFLRLRRDGWLVIRLWEHDIERDPEGCVDRIQGAVCVRSDGARSHRRSRRMEVSWGHRQGSFTAP